MKSKGLWLAPKVLLVAVSIGSMYVPAEDCKCQSVQVEFQPLRWGKSSWNLTWWSKASLLLVQDSRLEYLTTNHDAAYLGISRSGCHRLLKPYFAQFLYFDLRSPRFQIYLKTMIISVETNPRWKTTYRANPPNRCRLCGGHRELCRPLGL